MSSPSDAEVIGRSLGEPEAFGLIYDRHAAVLLRFLGRRAGAKVAEGLVGEGSTAGGSSSGCMTPPERGAPHGLAPTWSSGVPAIGTNSACPNLSMPNPLITPCVSGATMKSANALPPAAFTRGPLAGFTSITE